MYNYNEYRNFEKNEILDYIRSLNSQLGSYYYDLYIHFMDTTVNNSENNYLKDIVFILESLKIDWNNLKEGDILYHINMNQFSKINRVFDGNVHLSNKWVNNIESLSNDESYLATPSTYEDLYMCIRVDNIDDFIIFEGQETISRTGDTHPELIIPNKQKVLNYKLKYLLKDA